MKLVLVEHFVNDAEAWQKVMGEHFATFGVCLLVDFIDTRTLHIESVYDI